MELQKTIIKILREEISSLEKIRNFFSKKENTSDDKIINLLSKFIKGYYDISGHMITRYDGDKEIQFYWNNHKDVPKIMAYFPKEKKLEYSWLFTEDLYKFIPDNRLLHLDSGLVGKLFEKIYNKKVNKCFGYRYL